jgi:hypothetical protein
VQQQGRGGDGKRVCAWVSGRGKKKAFEEETQAELERGRWAGPGRVWGKGNAEFHWARPGVETVAGGDCRHGVRGHR